jgi:hypothetical protein
MYAADRDNGSLPLIRSQSGRPVVDDVHLIEKERDRLYQIGVIGSWVSKLVNGPAPSSRRQPDHTGGWHFRPREALFSGSGVRTWVSWLGLQMKTGRMSAHRSCNAGCQRPRRPAQTGSRGGRPVTVGRPTGAAGCSGHREAARRCPQTPRRRCRAGSIPVPDETPRRGPPRDPMRPRTDTKVDAGT